MAIDTDNNHSYTRLESNRINGVYMEYKCSFELLEHYFEIKNLSPEQRYNAIVKWENDAKDFLENHYERCEVVKLPFVV